MNPDDEYEFLGCPCCGAGEEKIEEDDNGELYCSNCNTNIEWAYENVDKLWSPLPEGYFSFLEL
jgi:hypothetical protein